MRLLHILTASLLASATAWSQSPSDDACSDPRANAQTLTQLALGSVVAGPFDVENAPPTPNIRMLGVEYAFGKYFVSGGAVNAAGTKYIYWFDTSGVYQGEIAQNNTMASQWGGRDGESDEAQNKLYFGEEGGRVSEYTWNGSTLTYTITYTIGSLGTVRALARNPTTGHFYTADFSSVIREFSLSGTIHNTFTNPGYAFYGFAWDECSGTLWGFAQTGSPLVTVVELDPATMVATGNTFVGVNGPSVNPIAGGIDMYEDSRNPGFLSFVAMHQATPDSLYVYDSAVPVCGGPGLQLLATGTCGGSMNFQVGGATPGGDIALVRAFGPGGPVTIPAGRPCAGTQLDLNSTATLAVILTAGPGGNAQTGPVTVPASVCGVVRVQALDLTTCTTSNVLLVQ